MKYPSSDIFNHFSYGGLLLILYAEQMAAAYALRTVIGGYAGGSNPYDSMRTFGFLTSVVGVIMFYKSAT